MSQMETYCTECGQTSTTPTPHCPNCGAEESWDERAAYQFDEDDLPFIFSMEVYNDNSELWREFCNAYWGVMDLTGSDTDLPEGFPRLKYGVFTVYFAITQSYELEGPFLDKSDARAAV